MRQRRFLALLLAFALLFGLAACGRHSGDSSVEPEGSASASVTEEAPPAREQEEETSFPFGVGYYKGLGLNPYTCNNAQNQSLMGLLYEPLYELDEKFAAQPCLAQSITAKVRTAQAVVQSSKKDSETGESGEDGAQQAKSVTLSVTDVTVKLRKGVKFTDGSGLHADDVAYSLRRAAAKGSVYRSRLDGLTNVETSGRNTVKFTLNGGNVHVAELLDIPIIKNGDGDELFPVGSGPYEVQRNKKGVPVRLVANDHWWRLGQEYEVALTQGVDSDSSAAKESVVTRTVELPLESIRVYTANDSDELIFGFSSGAVTAVSSDLTGIDALQYTGSFEVSDYSTTDLLYLGCNTHGGACAEQKARQALYRSIDRERVVRGMLAGHGDGAVLPVSPKSALYDRELAEKLDYEPDTAKKLCKKAGVGSLTLLVNKESKFKVAIAREIAKQLETAGVSVDVDVRPWKEYQQALKGGSYDLYLGEVKLNANFDLSRLVEEKGSLNFRKYKDKDLVKASRNYNQAGKDTRKKAASALYAAVAEQAPFIPVCFKSDSLLSRTGTVQRHHATQENLFHALWDWTIDETVIALSKKDA